MDPMVWTFRRIQKSLYLNPYSKQYRKNDTNFIMTMQYAEQRLGYDIHQFLFPEVNQFKSKHVGSSTK